MKETIIVLGAKSWEMVDETTKQTRAGISLHYLMTGNLNDYVDTVNNVRGYVPVKQSISLDEANNLLKVPGIYEGDFGLKSSQGKTVLALNHLKFIRDIDTSEKKG